MHPIVFDIGLAVGGATFVTVVMFCLWRLQRIDQCQADGRKRAQLLDQEPDEVQAEMLKTARLDQLLPEDLCDDRR